MLNTDPTDLPQSSFVRYHIASVIISSSDDLNLKTAGWKLLLRAIAMLSWKRFYVIALVGKQTAMLGFSGYLIFGLIIGCFYDHITNQILLFVVFYALLQSSGNFGRETCSDS